MNEKQKRLKELNYHQVDCCDNCKWVGYDHEWEARCKNPDVPLEHIALYYDNTQQVVRDIIEADYVCDLWEKEE